MNFPGVTFTLAIVALVVASVALLLAYFSWTSVQLLRRRTTTAGALATGGRKYQPVTGDKAERPFVIYNPAKVADLEHLRHLVETAASQYGAERPRWLATTREEPGTHQAIQAVLQGATLVLVAGGDGTLREVAAGLAHSQVSIGVLPEGTANLYAQNLGLPVTNLDECLNIAFTGRDHPSDLCWLRLVDPELPLPADVPKPDGYALHDAELDNEYLPDRLEYAFLVIAGMGIDAKLMSITSPELKQKIGWWAYVAAGFQSVHHTRMNANVTLGNAEPQEMQARTVLFANCGLVGAGLDLIPQADPDDGWLDVAAIDTAGGLIGWAELFGRVSMSGIGIEHSCDGLTSSIQVRRTRNALLELDKRWFVQVDGDSLGRARGVAVRMDNGALRMRVR